MIAYPEAETSPPGGCWKNLATEEQHADELNSLLRACR
jgi:hypothetical protein